MLMLLITASAGAASRPLSLLTARSGGRGAPPGIHTAKPQVQTELQLRSSSSSLSCAGSPSLSPGDDGRDSAAHLFDDFSVLSPVVPWEVDDIWRIYAGYFFILHIPLSFGGLGLVAKMLKCSSLDPMTTVISTVILQLVELSSALALLQYAAMPGNDVKAFFATKVSTRNWGKETVIGFTVLMTLVSTVSILGDKLVGHEDAYDPILTGILSDSPTSKLLCFILYCVIAPLSEETMYRGFLLNGLSSSLKWHEAVVISSIAFSVAHLSGSSFIQLFVVGCITGVGELGLQTFVSPTSWLASFSRAKRAKTKT